MGSGMKRGWLPWTSSKPGAHRGVVLLTKPKIGVVLIRNRDWWAGHSYFQPYKHKSKLGLIPLAHLFNLLLVSLSLSLSLSPSAPFIPHKQDNEETQTRKNGYKPEKVDRGEGTEGRTRMETIARR